MPARRFRYVCALLVAGPAAAFAQAPTGLIPPPVPTGAPLILPAGGAGDRSQVTAAVLPPAPPAGAAPFLDGPPPHPTPPPAGYANTDCNFNPWCGDNIFSPDYSSCEVRLGAYFSSKLGPSIPAFNYVPLTIRHGTMLTAPSDDGGRWRGNWEFLTDLTVAAITSDYGSWFGGPSFLLRYNYVQPGASLVPYSQAGAGFILNDAYRDRTQDAVGAFFEFRLHLEVGVKYFVSKNWSIDLEGGMQHISNADTAGRNLGVNAFGVTVGFTYYFPSGGR